MRSRFSSSLRPFFGSALALSLCAIAPQLVGCASDGDNSDITLPGADDGGDEGGGDGATAKCGNGVVEPGEACDDGTLNGADGPCLPTCKLACGDGVVEKTEKCDTKIAAGQDGACPTECTNAPTCQVGKVAGSACQAACEYGPVTDCKDGDGCCGQGCDGSNDSDCTAMCGNGKLEPGETCDPSGTCPTSCDDDDACTTDTTTGAPSTCDVACTHTAITACSMTSDGCCPAGCDGTSDADCSGTCGNGIKEGNETCDPGSTDGGPSVPCPTPADCDDGIACTTDAFTGSAAACNALCAHTDITTCVPGDGCCPAGCNSSNDGDCSASCGNSVVETGETCDTGISSGPGACPTAAACDDGAACTTDGVSGSGCQQQCVHTNVTACASGDGCCPAGCTTANDGDCSASCGDGVLNGNEACDKGIASGPGSCPSSCNDGNACTTDTLTGSAANCSAQCANAPITACSATTDGCCPGGCSANNDADCTATCDNSVVEPGETCDPPSSCPAQASCTKTNSCDNAVFTGDPAKCTAACSHTTITVCSMTTDGCCPSGCTGSNDVDCSATVSPASTITAGTCLTATTTAKTPIVVTLVDTLGNPMIGAAVTITATAGTVSSVSSSGNKYWATLQAPAAVGATSSTVTVVANGVTLTTKPVVTLAAPFTDLGGGAGGCSVQGNLRVRVVDAVGNAISGANVMVGGAQAATAYATTYGGSPSAPNTATTDANGYAEFLDYGSVLSGKQMVTAGKANYSYFTFADLNAADLVIPLDLVKPVVQTGTTTGAFQDASGGTLKPPSGDPIEFGLMLPDTNLKNLANLSLASLLGDSTCYKAGGLAGDMSIPSNVFIQSQCAASLLGCLQNLPTHDYLSPAMAYGSRILTALYGSAPLSALTGSGGIAAGVPSISLNSAGAINPYAVASAGPATQNIKLTQADSNDVNCTLSNLPATSDVFCATAVDFDSAGSGGSLLPGEGRLGLTGFKAVTLGAGATSTSITKAPRVPKAGPFASSDYLGAIAALYLDKARPGIPVGAASGVSAVIKRAAPYGTSGGTMTVADMFPIRVLTQNARTAGLSAAPAAPSVTADFVVHTFTQEVSTKYTSCQANDSTKTVSYTVWKVYTPGSTVSVTLPTLPASWPSAGAAGNFAGMVDPAATADTDSISWNAMTVHEARATAFDYDAIVLKEFTKYATHITSNTAGWCGGPTTDSSGAACTNGFVCGGGDCHCDANADCNGGSNGTCTVATGLCTCGKTVCGVGQRCLAGGTCG